MKNLIASVTLFTLVLSTNVYARDTLYMINYKDAMETAEAKSKIGDEIKFFFGEQKTPAIKDDLGEANTNRKTNAFNKSDLQACNWVFISAMLALRDRARQLGADAVINIQSNYKSKKVKSDTQFECGAGALMAGVALTGKYVKFKK